MPEAFDERMDKMLRDFQQRTRTRAQELGVIDGLTLASWLLHRAGMCEAAKVVSDVADERARRLIALLDAEDAIAKMRE